MRSKFDAPLTGWVRLLVLPVVLSVPRARAQDSAPNVPQPARALVTVQAAGMEAGELSVQSGYQQAYGRDHSLNRRVPAEIDLGALPRVVLRVGWSGPSYLRNDQGVVSGSGDPQFGALVHAITQDQAGLDLGLSYWHKAPWAAAEKGLQTGKPDDTGVLTASRTSGRWQLDVNAGANWVGREDGPGRVRQGVASAAVTRACGSGWHVSAETFAQAGTELGPRTVTSSLMVARNLTSRLTADVGVEAGLTQSAQRLALDAGLVWRVGRLWGGK